MGQRAAALGLGARSYTGAKHRPPWPTSWPWPTLPPRLAELDGNTGMKIFVTWRPSHRGYIDDGHTLLEHLRSGFLIQPGSQRQLTDAIETLLRDGDLRAQLGRNAQAKILHNFTWDHTVAKIEAVCNGVIGRRAPAAEPAQPAEERS